MIAHGAYPFVAPGRSDACVWPADRQLAVLISTRTDTCFRQSHGLLDTELLTSHPRESFLLSGEPPNLALLSSSLAWLYLIVHKSQEHITSVFRVFRSSGSRREWIA